MGNNTRSACPFAHPDAGTTHDNPLTEKQGMSTRKLLSAVLSAALLPMAGHALSEPRIASELVNVMNGLRRSHPC